VRSARRIKLSRRGEISGSPHRPGRCILAALTARLYLPRSGRTSAPRERRPTTLVGSRHVCVGNEIVNITRYYSNDGSLHRSGRPTTQVWVFFCCREECSCFYMPRKACSWGGHPDPSGGCKVAAYSGSFLAAQRPVTTAETVSGHGSVFASPAGALRNPPPRRNRLAWWRPPTRWRSGRRYLSPRFLLIFFSSRLADQPRPRSNVCGFTSLVASDRSSFVTPGCSERCGALAPRLPDRPSSPTPARAGLSDERRDCPGRSSTPGG